MKTILINLLLLVLFYSSILSQSEYQIINLPDNLFQLSSNNGFSALTNYNSTSNPGALVTKKNQSYSFINYPAGIKFFNFRIKNISISILNYGNFEDKIDNVINKSFDANELLFKYYYNKKLKNNVRIGFSIGTYYSQIYKYNAYGIIASIGVNKTFPKINLGLGFSIENLGSILKNYTVAEVTLPSIYSINLCYKFKNILLGYKFIEYFKNNHNEHVISVQFRINKAIFLQVGTSSYRKKLTINNNYKYLYGMSCGIGFNVNNFEINLGIKNLGISGSAFGISINKTIN